MGEASVLAAYDMLRKPSFFLTNVFRSESLVPASESPAHIAYGTPEECPPFSGTERWTILRFADEVTGAGGCGYCGFSMRSLRLSACCPGGRKCLSMQCSSSFSPLWATAHISRQSHCMHPASAFWDQGTDTYREVDSLLRCILCSVSWF